MIASIHSNPRFYVDVPAPAVLLSSLETATQWSIIFLAIVTMTFFIIASAFAVILGLLSRTLLKKTIVVVDENVRPTLDSVKSTAVSVKGTTEYVSESAVKPVVRVYGVIAGVRRFASVIAGLTGAGTEKS